MDYIEELSRNLIALRHQIATEKGTETQCPLCGRPRVKRSDYVRCNSCGLNWLEGMDLNMHPHNQPPQPILDTARTDTSAKKPAETSAEAADGRLSYEARKVAQEWKQLGKRATEGHHVACLCPLCVRARAEAAGLKKPPAAATGVAVESETA